MLSSQDNFLMNEFVNEWSFIKVYSWSSLPCKLFMHGTLQLAPGESPREHFKSHLNISSLFLST